MGHGQLTHHDHGQGTADALKTGQPHPSSAAFHPTRKTENRMAYALKDHPLTGKTAFEIAGLIDKGEITTPEAAAYLQAKKRLSLQAKVLLRYIEEGLPIGQYQEITRQTTTDVFSRRKEAIAAHKAADAERKRKKEAEGQPAHEPGSPEDIKDRVARLQEALSA